MWIIREVEEPELNQTQLGLLLSIFMAGDSRQSWDFTEGTQQLVVIRNELIKMMYVIGNSNDGITLTTNGIHALRRQNAININNQLTSEGKQLLINIQKNKNDQINNESLVMLKSFYQ